MMMRKSNLFFCIGLVWMCLPAAGCKTNHAIKKPDISGISVDATVIRFEKSLMDANGANYKEILHSLEKQYPEFYNLYVHDVLNMPAGDSTYNVYDTLYKYVIADAYMLRLNDSVENLYADISDVQQQIEAAFTYHTYYFPHDTLPQLYTYIAPFVYQVVLGESVMGIELNMFMGKNFGYYSAFAANLPQYVLYNFERRNIAVQVMRMMMDKKIPGKGADANLLDDMITEGKMLYYLDAVLPDVADSVKIGYSAKQMEWCENTSVDIWKFFAGEELLFSTSMQDKQRYIADAPTTYSMPAESPGRVAVWVGWQIVRDYMKKNNSSLQQLLQETDALKILKESNYDGR